MNEFERFYLDKPVFHDTDYQTVKENRISELKTQVRHWQDLYEKERKYHEETAKKVPQKGSLVIREGEHLPPGFMTVLHHEDIMRRVQHDHDRMRGVITDAMGTTALNRMESDLGKVRAALGKEAFDRIVGRV